jgi:undecaprenyl-diphosphatase
MTFEARLWTACATFAVLFVALGLAVAHRPPSWFDIRAVGFRGQALGPAVALTTSGRAPFLLAFSIVMATIFAFARANVLIPVGVIVSQTASQGAVELIKHAFHRLRPDYWIVGRELGYSFPSGHACTSVVFYGAWLALIAFSPLPKPVKIALGAIVAIWMLGIDWSRLALGAHYATDVIGGTIFGLAWICAIWALLVHFHVPLRA